MIHDVYRDGRVHVLAVECSTCVFRPGNLMRLEPGRLSGMVRDAVAAESTIVCHSTLYRHGIRNAACRGFFDRHKTQPLQVRGTTRADRMGARAMIERRQCTAMVLVPVFAFSSGRRVTLYKTRRCRRTFHRASEGLCWQHHDIEHRPR